MMMAVQAKYPEPVMNMFGNLVRLVVVAPGEMTCLRCGETSGGCYCVRCGAKRSSGMGRTMMVETTSYLHPEEFRIQQ